MPDQQREPLKISQSFFGKGFFNRLKIFWEANPIKTILKSIAAALGYVTKKHADDINAEQVEIITLKSKQAQSLANDPLNNQQAIEQAAASQVSINNSHDVSLKQAARASQNFDSPLLKSRQEIFNDLKIQIAAADSLVVLRDLENTAIVRFKQFHEDAIDSYSQVGRLGNATSSYKYYVDQSTQMVNELNTLLTAKKAELTPKTPEGYYKYRFHEIIRTDYANEIRTLDQFYKSHQELIHCVNNNDLTLAEKLAKLTPDYKKFLAQRKALDAKIAAITIHRQHIEAPKGGIKAQIEYLTLSVTDATSLLNNVLRFYQQVVPKAPPASVALVANAKDEVRYLEKFIDQFNGKKIYINDLSRKDYSRLMQAFEAIRQLVNAVANIDNEVKDHHNAIMTGEYLPILNAYHNQPPFEEAIAKRLKDKKHHMLDLEADLQNKKQELERIQAASLADRHYSNFMSEISVELQKIELLFVNELANGITLKRLKEFAQHEPAFIANLQIDKFTDYFFLRTPQGIEKQQPVTLDIIDALAAENPNSKLAIQLSPALMEIMRAINQSVDLSIADMIDINTSFDKYIKSVLTQINFLSLFKDKTGIEISPVILSAKKKLLEEQMVADKKTSEQHEVEHNPENLFAVSDAEPISELIAGLSAGNKIEEAESEHILELFDLNDAEPLPELADAHQVDVIAQANQAIKQPMSIAAMLMEELKMAQASLSTLAKFYLLYDVELDLPTKLNNFLNVLNPAYNSFYAASQDNNNPLKKAFHDRLIKIQSLLADKNAISNEINMQLMTIKQNLSIVQKFNNPKVQAFLLMNDFVHLFNGDIDSPQLVEVIHNMNNLETLAGEEKNKINTLKEYLIASGLKDLTDETMDTLYKIITKSVLVKKINNVNLRQIFADSSQLYLTNEHIEKINTLVLKALPFDKFHNELRLIVQQPIKISQSMYSEIQMVNYIDQLKSLVNKYPINTFAGTLDEIQQVFPDMQNFVVEVDKKYRIAEGGIKNFIKKLLGQDKVPPITEFAKFIANINDYRQKLKEIIPLFDLANKLSSQQIKAALGDAADDLINLNARYAKIVTRYETSLYDAMDLLLVNNLKYFNAQLDTEIANIEKMDINVSIIEEASIEQVNKLKAQLAEGKKVLDAKLLVTHQIISALPNSGKPELLEQKNIFEQYQQKILNLVNLFTSKEAAIETQMPDLQQASVAINSAKTYANSLQDSKSKISTDAPKSAIKQMNPERSKVIMPVNAHGLSYQMAVDGSSRYIRPNNHLNSLNKEQQSVAAKRGYSEDEKVVIEHMVLNCVAELLKLGENKFNVSGATKLCHKAARYILAIVPAASIYINGSTTPYKPDISKLFEVKHKREKYEKAGLTGEEILESKLNGTDIIEVPANKFTPGSAK